MPDPSASPLWMAGTLTADFEPTTLPLLLTPLSDFDYYFNALRKCHPSKQHEFDALRLLHAQCRDAHADGRDEDTIAYLGQAINLRRFIFAADDYQVVAAEVHFAMVLAHFATQFTVHGFYDVAYRYFNLAKTQITSKLLPGLSGNARHVFLCVLYNNWANYWVSRGKPHQGLDCAERAKAAYGSLPNTDPIWRQYFSARVWCLLCACKRSGYVLTSQEKEPYDLITEPASTQMLQGYPNGPTLSLHTHCSVPQYSSDLPLHTTTGFMSLYCRGLAIRDLGPRASVPQLSSLLDRIEQVCQTSEAPVNTFWWNNVLLLCRQKVSATKVSPFAMKKSQHVHRGSVAVQRLMHSSLHALKHPRSPVPAEIEVTWLHDELPALASPKTNRSRTTEPPSLKQAAATYDAAMKAKKRLDESPQLMAFSPSNTFCGETFDLKSPPSRRSVQLPPVETTCLLTEMLALPKPTRVRRMTTMEVLSNQDEAERAHAASLLAKRISIQQIRKRSAEQALVRDGPQAAVLLDESIAELRERSVSGPSVDFDALAAVEERRIESLSQRADDLRRRIAVVRERIPLSSTSRPVSRELRTAMFIPSPRLSPVIRPCTVRGTTPVDYASLFPSGNNRDSSEKLVNLEVQTTGKTDFFASFFYGTYPQRGNNSPSRSNLVERDAAGGTVRATKLLNLVPHHEVIGKKQNALRAILTSLDPKSEMYRIVLKELAENQRILAAHQAEIKRGQLQQAADRLAKTLAFLKEGGGGNSQERARMLVSKLTAERRQKERLAKYITFCVWYTLINAETLLGPRSSSRRISSPDGGVLKRSSSELKRRSSVVRSPSNDGTYGGSLDL